MAGAALTALLVFGAVPTVLLSVVGDPLGQGLGHLWSAGARDCMAGLAAVAWVAWTACSVQLVRAVVAHVRSGEVAPVGTALGERIAARMAAGILSLGVLGVPGAISAGAGAAGPQPTQVSPFFISAPSTTAIPATGALQAAATATYVVQPGDSLWSIADAQLGDGADWTAISALNLGRTMPGGRRFVDPSMICAGWTLLMPAGRAGAPPAAAPPAPPPAPVVVLAQPVARRAGPVPAASHRAHSHAARPEGAALPEMLALGFGAIGCAAVARRTRRARLLRQMGTTPQRPGDGPGDLAMDMGTLLGRFDGMPALRSFEEANSLLASALAESAPPGPGTSVREPRVRAICVGPDGVDFWLAAPAGSPPPGFSDMSEGLVWRVAHSALSEVEAGPPLLPIVLPVGDDDEGTWLLPIQRGCCLPLIGAESAALWRAARLVQESWAWAPSVVITDDPAVVSVEVRLSPVSAGRAPDPPPVLYSGDPAALPPDLRRLVSVVTTDASASATDLTVLVDSRAATLHPLGKTVRPQLVSAGTAATVDELTTAPAPSADDEDLDDVDRDTADTGIPVPSSAHLHGPGAVEVKLLTMTPRLEGLREELPQNRARRAVELVAYLALHRPDDVTSDRLRTRVLGSASADAAAKTLFNTATAARRAMGTDHAGQPLFPSGSRTGHYRVSESVSVDVQRAVNLAAVGSAAEDPREAMAHLRAALALVEGEPLANALSGYTWWEAEGHGARIAAVLVNAACDLAALAVDAGHFELAQWGLAQARLVDPYSEALSRVAMQVAAAAGDADRLRHEWRECQRRVDELDPGSSPSPRTERLYGELAQRVLVGTPAAGVG